MALIIDKEALTGITVGFWVADISTLNIIVASDTYGNLTITGSVCLKGYTNETALLDGKSNAMIVVIVVLNDLTQDECGDLFKKVGKTNLRKEIYKVVKTRTGWDTATEDNTNEDIYSYPLL